MEAWDSGAAEIAVVSAEEATRAQPRIREFVELCDTARGDGVLTFEAVQGQAFMPYWKNLGILRWDGSRSEFVFVFYGTDVAAISGRDYTGKGFADGGPERAAAAQEIHRRALFDRQTVYFRGSLGWRNKSYLGYVGVAMPLRRGNVVEETVSCVFSPALA